MEPDEHNLVVAVGVLKVVVCFERRIVLGKPVLDGGVDANLEGRYRGQDREQQYARQGQPPMLVKLDRQSMGPGVVV